MGLNVFPANPNEGDTVQVNGIYYIPTSWVWDVVSRVKSNIRALVER